MDLCRLLQLQESTDYFTLSMMSPRVKIPFPGWSDRTPSRGSVRCRPVKPPCPNTWRVLQSLRFSRKAVNTGLSMASPVPEWYCFLFSRNLPGIKINISKMGVPWDPPHSPFLKMDLNTPVTVGGAAILFSHHSFMPILWFCGLAWSGTFVCVGLFVIAWRWLAYFFFLKHAQQLHHNVIMYYLLCCAGEPLKDFPEWTVESCFLSSAIACLLCKQPCFIDFCFEKHWELSVWWN